jgi:uncharacterized membrane protein YhaH (DUF805 family)
MFAGTLSRGEYARAAGLRFGLFAAAVLAIPVASYAVDQSQYCPPDFCGPRAATLIALFVMPVFYLGLMISLIGITVRRLRDLGLTGALAAVIPILMFGDLLAALTLDGFVFDAYVPNAAHPIPGNLVMALACVGWLCVARSDNEPTADFAQRWGAVGALALVVLTLASIFALLKFLSEISMAIGGVWSHWAVVYAIFYGAALVAPILLIVLFAMIALRERRSRAA